MIDKILEFALRQRSVVVLGACALVVAGIFSAIHLRIDAVPDITGVQVQVNTEVPALAAEESEKLVTQPIEQELAGLPGLHEMRSLTKFGLSQVTLQFHDGTDLFRARQLVAERMQGVADRLQSFEIPAEAVESNAGVGFTLEATAQTESVAAGRRITATWTLRSRRGEVAGTHQQSTTLTEAALTAGTGADIGDFANDAGAAIAAFIVGIVM